ncbi:hypothetical protein LLG88_13690 [bacterium]|nr:hypothetical protein [bacterium]
MSTTIYDYDGFDDYTSPAREHARVIGTPTTVTGGRFGGRRLLCQAATAMGDYVSRFARSGGTPTLAARCVVQVTNQLARAIYLFDFQNGDGGHVSIRLNPDGSLSALRDAAASGYDFSQGGVGATVLGTSEAGVVGATAVSLQAVVTIHATAGTIDVYVNDTNVLQLTGLNTQNGATASITHLVYGCGYCGPAATAVYFDDLILASDVVGDYRVDSHFPTGDSLDNNFGTPVGGSGTDHYTRVNESPEPDDLTTYVVLSGVGDRETYGHDVLKNAGAPIVDVMAVLDARIEAAGWGSVAASVQVADDHFDSSAQGLSTSIQRFRPRFTVNPATDLAWTEAEFNAMEAGAVKTY